MVSLAIAGAAFLALLIAVDQPPANSLAPHVVATPTTETVASLSLTDQKTLAEIRQIEIANSTESGWQGRLVARLPVITALAAVFGAVVAFLRYQADMDARERARQGQQDKDRAQQESERLRHIDEKLGRIAKNVQSPNPSLAALAAADLMTFTHSENISRRDQAFVIALGGLKAKHDEPAVDRLLRTAFEQLARARSTVTTRADVSHYLDLSHTKLSWMDLSHLNLDGANLTGSRLDSANLKGSTMSGARCGRARLDNASLAETVLVEASLVRASCRKADFDGANLCSANLKLSDLTKARFRGARLQSAHFEGSSCLGARFDQADVNDTFFTGAVFDDSALASLIRARNWTKAHFEATVRQRLERLAAGLADTR